jgi:hypothetical protein
VEARFANASLAKAYVIQDVQNGKVNSAEYKNVWLVFTAREEHWKSIGRDEREIIARYLQQRGCHQELERHFTNLEAMKVACGTKVDDAPQKTATTASVYP